MFNQQPSARTFCFVLFPAIQRETTAATLLKQTFQKPARHLQKALGGVFARARAACLLTSRILTEFGFPILLSDAPALHFIETPRARVTFKARRIRASETLKHNLCSLSLSNRRWCALQLQDTTLNSPRRNLKRACALMNKDVRADSVVTGSEQLTEQMH